MGSFNTLGRTGGHTTRDGSTLINGSVISTHLGKYVQGWAKK